MNCREFDRLIDAFIYGELPAQRALACEKHASGCLTCGERLRAWRLLSSGARRLQRVSAPATFEQDLMRRIRAGEHRERRFRIWQIPRPLIRTLVYACLVLAVSVPAALLYQRSTSDGQQEVASGPGSLPAVPRGVTRVAPEPGTFDERLRPLSFPGDAAALEPFPANFPAWPGAALPGGTEYVDFLLKGTGDREVYVRLPRTIVYHAPAGDNLYYVRNVSY